MRPHTAMIITRPVSRHNTCPPKNHRINRPRTVPKLNLGSKEVGNEYISSFREIRGFFEPTPPKTSDKTKKPLFKISKKKKMIDIESDNSARSIVTTTGAPHHQLSRHSVSMCKHKVRTEHDTKRADLSKPSHCPFAVPNPPSNQNKSINISRCKDTNKTDYDKLQQLTKFDLENFEKLNPEKFSKSIQSGQMKSIFIDGENLHLLENRNSGNMYSEDSGTNCSGDNYNTNAPYFSFVREKTMLIQNNKVCQNKASDNIRWVAYQTERQNETSAPLNCNDYINNNPTSSTTLDTKQESGGRDCTQVAKQLKDRLIISDSTKREVGNKFDSKPNNLLTTLKINKVMKKTRQMSGITPEKSKVTGHFMPKSFSAQDSHDKSTENTNDYISEIYEITNKLSQSKFNSVHGIETDPTHQYQDQRDRLVKESEPKYFRGVIPTPPPSALKKSGSASSSIDKRQKVKFDMEIEVHIVPRDSYLPSPTESTTTELDERDFKDSFIDEDTDETSDDVTEDESGEVAFSDDVRPHFMQSNPPFRIIQNGPGYGRSSASLPKRDSFDLAQVQKLLSQQARDRVLQAQQNEVALRTPVQQKFRTPPRTPFAFTREYRHKHHRFSQNTHKPTIKQPRSNSRTGGKTPEEYITFYSRQQQLQQYMDYERRLRRQHLYSGQIRNHSVIKNQRENQTQSVREVFGNVVTNNGNLVAPKPYLESTKQNENAKIEGSASQPPSDKHENVIEIIPQTNIKFSNSYPKSNLRRSLRNNGRPCSQQHSNDLLWSRGGSRYPQKSEMARQLSTRDKDSALQNRRTKKESFLENKSVSAKPNISFAKLSENARAALKEAHNSYYNSVNEITYSDLQNLKKSPRGLAFSEEPSGNEKEICEEIDSHFHHHNQQEFHNIPNRSTSHQESTLHSTLAQYGKNTSTFVVDSLGLNATIPSRPKEHNKYWFNKFKKTKSIKSSNLPKSKNGYLISQGRASSDDYVELLRGNTFVGKMSQQSKKTSYRHSVDFLTKKSPSISSDITKYYEEISPSIQNKITA